MDRERFKRLLGEGKRVAVYRELMFDTAIPPIILSCFEGSSLFLLESANTKKEFSRYTYFGLPKKVKVLEGCDPFKELEEMVEVDVSSVEELGDFNGGVVFMLGYGASNYTGVLRSPVREGRDLTLLMEVNEFFVLDNHTQKLYACVVSDDFDEAQSRIDELEDVLRRSVSSRVPVPSGYEVKDVSWEFSPDGFRSRVAYVRELIEQGEAIQVVISQKVEVSGNLSPVSFYRYLRKLNPSPYMFYLSHQDVVYCGSSPEVHLRVKNSRALMKPIAGTYPVGPDLERIIEALSSDEKERAEHLMLVDLARNDLYTYCESESVVVKRFMEPEVYSHVVHLVSTVEGSLQRVSPVELLRMTFPAGTVTGAPKVRAMEIIDEVEASSRDFYAGCVGYYSYNGNLDTCITIRSAKFERDTLVLRAGAGIVYDSVPEREHQEVVNKLRALLVSVENASIMEV